MNSRSSLVLPMPASPETSAISGPSPLRTSAASTRPSNRSSDVWRPIITGDKPFRPRSMVCTLLVSASEPGGLLPAGLDAACSGNE